VDLVALNPAPPVLHVPLLHLPLGPGLAALSVLGAWLALRAHRSGAASLTRALLHASLPGALWLLVASLNPERPTGLLLTPFGAGLALGFLCGLLAAQRAARRAHSTWEHSVGCYLWSCAGALLGARVAYVAAHLAQFSSGRGVLALHAGGLAMNGALLGAVAVSGWCFRDQPLRWRTWLDGMAPALGLALALGASGACLQGPTTSSLLAAASGLVLSGAASALGRWQRFHGQSFVLVALGYGIVQLSTGSASSDPGLGVEGWGSRVASLLVVALAGVAGWVWHKSFTFRRF
jgi:Prolipoprotein diacylglyceryl transferase